MKMPRTASFLTLLALGTPILANSCIYKTYTDTFDNYTSLLPELAPIAYDGGLFYDFDAVPGLIAGVGVIPASSPNIAGASANQDFEKLGVVTVNPFGVITTRGTATKYFALLEFNYACSLFTNNVPAPTGCALEVYGYDIYGNRTASLALNYAPTSATSSPMSRAVMPLGFTLLQNVTIGIATAGSTTATTVLYVDNVKHVNCY